MDIKQLLQEVTDSLGPTFDQFGWAEEEIAKAMDRHGEKAPERDANDVVIGEKGPVWQSFRLLVSTHPRMSTEFVYRAHCAELLDRVANGQDTRPGTDAELALALMDTSLMAPLRSSSAGLYMRVFARAFPDEAKLVFAEDTNEPDDYERLYKSQMDADEAWLRRKLRQDWRKAEREVKS